MRLGGYGWGLCFGFVCLGLVCVRAALRWFSDCRWLEIRFVRVFWILLVTVWLYCLDGCWVLLLWLLLVGLVGSSLR